MGGSKHDITLFPRQDTGLAHDSNGIEPQGDRLFLKMIRAQEFVHNLKGLGAEGVIHNHDNRFLFMDILPVNRQFRMGEFACNRVTVNDHDINI